jgi:hypothetical protein
MTVVKKEPAGNCKAKLNNTDVKRIANFINTNATDVEAENYTVPFSYTWRHPPANIFPGGRSLVPTLSIHWNGTPSAGLTFINVDYARHIFLLNTCNLFHGGETNTVFTHFKRAAFDSAAALSVFLTGTTVSDPAEPPESRNLNDLQRRRLHEANLADSDCR